MVLDVSEDSYCHAVETKFYDFVKSKLQESEAKIRQLGELRDTLHSLLQRRSVL